MTGHSAQGLDAKRVILEKDAHSRTTNHRSFYTDLTRAREAALVVTDSARRLAQLVRSDLTKSAALDVVGPMGPGAIASERQARLSRDRPACALGRVGFASAPAPVSCGRVPRDGVCRRWILMSATWDRTFLSLLRDISI